MDSDNILCVGYARLPEGSTMAVLYKVFGLGLVINPQSGIIVNAQTTCATKLGDDFLTKFFINKNIETDFSDILRRVGKCYRGNGCKAILAAAQKAYIEYLNYKNEQNSNPEVKMYRLEAKIL